MAYYDPIRQSRRYVSISVLSLYATPLLCGSTSASHGTFPTFTAVLSVHVADPTPAVRQALPLYSLGDSRLPPLIKGVANRDAVSASYIRRAITFRRCIVRFMLRPTRLPCPPDWLRRDEITCSSSRLLKYFVTPAFDVARYRSTLGVRLDGRMGNLPSSGLSPDQLQQLVRLHDKNYWLPFGFWSASVRASPSTSERAICKLPGFRPSQTAFYIQTGFLDAAL